MSEINAYGLTPDGTMIPYEVAQGGFFDREGNEWEEDHEHPDSAWNRIMLRKVKVPNAIKSPISRAIDIADRIEAATGDIEKCLLTRADTIGSAIDALNKAVSDINAASERMKAFGLSPQISVNGHDYGDKVSVYVQGELVRPAENRTAKP